MTNLLTSISILIALLTWFFTHLSSQKNQKISHTAQIIANLSTCERLAESSFQLTRLINRSTKITFSEIDEGTERYVVDILDYYEYLCDLYERGVLDRQTILTLRGKLMKKTYEACSDYIQGTRDAQKRKVYSGFERFVKDLAF